MVETAKQISINDVVGGGIKLSMLLNAVSCEVTSPGVEIHNTSKAVSFLCLNLKQIGQGFRAADSLHTGDALSTARKIAVQGRVIFDEIEQMLDKARVTGGCSIPLDSSLNQRYSRSFKPHRIAYLLAHLESLQLSLTIMFLVFQVGKLMVAQRDGDKSQKSPTNNIVQQERMDAQNMVIVRQGSIDRLHVLYDLSKREAYLSHNEEKPATGKIPENPTLSTPPYQLPVIPLGDFKNPPSSMNGSPRDMIHESARVVDQLISLWIRRDVDGEIFSATNKSRRSDRNLSCTSEPHLHGHCMDEASYDWRTPPSPSPNKSGSHLRGGYSEYQSGFDSDSDSSDDKKTRPKPGRSGSGLFNTTDDGSSTDGLRRHRRGKADTHKKTRFEEPISRTHLYASQSHTKSSQPRIPSSQQQQNRNGAYHPAPFPPQYQQQHYRPRPLHYDPPETRHRRRDDRSSYDTSDQDERCRRLKRNATKGILGIGALAGFLAALEKI